MPSIEWRHNNDYRRCDSSDPVIVARFLLEQVALYSPGYPSDFNSIQIVPMYDRNKLPDWPGMQVSFAINTREDMSRLAQYIMAWQAERTRPLTGMEEENAQPVSAEADEADPGSTLFS